MIRLRTFGTPPYDSWITQLLSWNNWNYNYKDMVLVDDDSYTHAAIFGLSTPQLKVPKEKVVGFSVEPYEIHNIRNNLSWIVNNVGTYYCIDNSGLPESTFKNGIPYLGACCSIHTMEIPNKTKKISMIASSKGFFYGHQLRHHIIQTILNSDLEIDIYGRGLEYAYKDNRIKGTIENKNIALDDYKFSIAIENISYNYWVTEKFYDPIMRGCVPIYWGAKCALSEYGDCFINIEDLSSIKSLLKYISDYSDELYNSKKIKEAQDLIKNKHNLPEAVWRHFNGK